MADSTAAGWYYTKSGGPGQQVGPLSWEQLYSLRSSGSLQPDDLVWHPTMPQWLLAIQIPTLFQTAAQPPVFPPGAPQGAGYGPAYQAPYQQGPYQRAPYQTMGQPAWAAQNSYQPVSPKRSSVAAWLIPLIVLVLVGGGLGAYFGFWYHKGGPVSASDLVGLWEGTLKYESLDLKDASEEDLAIRDATLGKEIPATLELTLDEGAGATANAKLVRAAAAEDKVSGTATLTMDLSVIDESYGEVTDNMSFTYSGNKLTFQSTDLESGGETVTATVSRSGDLISMEGTMSFEDETGSGKAGWTVSKKSPVTGSNDSTGGDGGDGGTGDSGTVTTQGDGAGTIAPADLNGTWNGTLTITSYTGDPWAERGLTGALLGTITGLPIPVTMEMTADENGTGTGQMLVSATTLGAAFDIGTADMPLTTSGTTLTFQPESWPWGVPTMIGEVTQAGGVLEISGTFSYASAASTFDAVFNLTK